MCAKPVNSKQLTPSTLQPTYSSKEGLPSKAKPQSRFTTIQKPEISELFLKRDNRNHLYMAKGVENFFNGFYSEFEELGRQLSENEIGRAHV